MQQMSENQTRELKEQIRMRLLRQEKEPVRLVPTPPTPMIPTPTQLEELCSILDDIGIDYDTEDDDFGTLLQIGTVCFMSALPSLEFDGDGFYIG